MPDGGQTTRERKGHIPTPSTVTETDTGVGIPAARRAGIVVTLVLGGLTALPPLSMDMYLPALPAVTRALGSSAATAQLTLTACLMGMALGQLVVGPMSDKWGRRKPLLLGMVVYVFATAICALAPSVELLIGFRLLQGLAGAAGIVIARAVVRDLYDGVEMARFFSTLMLISGVAPVIAPVIGGQVLQFTDWRGIFVVLTGVGIALTLVVVKWLHETLPSEKRHSGGVGEALGTMRGLLADRVFTGYTLAGGLAFAALFAYIAASPFVVQEIYGASPQMYSLLFGINSIGLITVGQINGQAAGRPGQHGQGAGLRPRRHHARRSGPVADDERGVRGAGPFRGRGRAVRPDVGDGARDAQHQRAGPDADPARSRIGLGPHRYGVVPDRRRRVAARRDRR